MEEFAYLPLPSGGIGPNHVGFIRKAIKNMLPHELEFLKETEGMQHDPHYDKEKLTMAVNKLFAANKIAENNDATT